MKEARYYLLEEIRQKDLMSKIRNNVSTDLNYTEQLLILVSAITGQFKCLLLLWWLVFL